MDDILTTSLKIVAVGVVGGVTFVGLNRYLSKDGKRKVENTTPSSSSSMLCSNRIDSVDSSLPSLVRSEISERKIDIEASHKHLMKSLNDQIQANGTEEFENIQRFAEIHIGRAKALSCMNIGGIIEQLEQVGEVSPGKYEVLKDILNKSGMNHYKVTDSILEIEEKIQGLLCEPSISVESITSSHGEAVTATDVNASAPQETVKDAVVFYADTDSARQEAIKFKNTVTDLTFPCATISLKDEVGLGNLTESRSWEEMISTHRYVFILMTKDLDEMTYFASDSLLDRFIRTKQARMVPIWLSPDRSSHPVALSALSGQSYFLMSSSSSGVPELYKEGFRKLIYRGRKEIKLNSS